MDKDLMGMSEDDVVYEYESENEEKDISFFDMNKSTVENVGETTPEVQTVQETETIPEMQTVQKTEAIPEMQTVPQMETIPETQTAPEMETIPEIQNVPEMQPCVEREEVWRHEPDSPYSPLYVPEQKSNNKLTIVCIVMLILCLIVGMILAVSKLVESAMKEVSTEIPAWQESFESWKDSLADNDTKEPDENNIFSNDEWEDEYPVIEEYPYNEYEGDEYSQYEEYVPSESDEYYVQLADSIRDDLSYSVDKKEYTYSDQDMGVNIYVEYASVEGLAFDDKINEALEENAMYYTKEFGSADVTDFYLLVESYVTYMDEEILSVVISEEYMLGYDMYVDLYCMNFDLHTGTLLYNTDMIEPTEELIDAFVKMSEYQNGYIEYFDEISKSDMQALFTNEDSFIIFYTPVGLEVGFNYPYGWVTATIKDYEQYLNKL